MNEKPKFGEICWNELATPNVQAAKDFYGNVFGWEFIDKDMGDMTYTMIKKGAKDIGGIWAIPKEQQKQIPPHWMAYILVEKLEDALEKASMNGAKIMKDPTEVGDFGRFAIIIDPTGAHIALWQVLS
jgi:predicted enzyme related to lactoylglutathione lyase